VSSSPSSVHALDPRPARVNMAQFLVERARVAPNELAIRVAKKGPSGIRFEDTTFAALSKRSGELAIGLTWAGITRGARVSLFVKPGVELIAITFALLRIGAIPVLIDPGMGPRNVLSCVERMRPSAFIGIPLAHVIRRLKPTPFRNVRVNIVTSGRGSKLISRLGLAKHIDDVIQDGWDKNEPLLDVPADTEAAILFTSGSTGPPKGVTYTHGMFAAQVDALKALYNMQPGEVDVACLPVFALFSPALGFTCVFPPINPSKPAECDPALLAETIQKAGATTTFGSPAIWRRVVPYAKARGLTFPSLKRVLIAGAPVPTDLLADFKTLLGEGADIHTPYGATECLPVASASATELLEGGEDGVRTLSESGGGTCVGRVAPGIDLRLLPITQAAIPTWAAAQPYTQRPGERCPASGYGEIVVRGPVVTAEYKFEEAATAQAKIPVDAEHATGPGAVWHRIGDAGYLDAQGRLWFAGRVAHRLHTSDGLVMPVPTENIYNTHPAVERSALVGLGEGLERPILLVRLAGEHQPSAELAAELLAYGARHPLGALVEGLAFKDTFPVDVRHNAKIHRTELKLWLADQSSEVIHTR
jgi:olefin beta-lactone synthetase